MNLLLLRYVLNLFRIDREPCFCFVWIGDFRKCVSSCVFFCDGKGSEDGLLLRVQRMVRSDIIVAQTKHFTISHLVAVRQPTQGPTHSSLCCIGCLVGSLARFEMANIDVAQSREHSSKQILVHGFVYVLIVPNMLDCRGGKDLESWVVFSKKARNACGAPSLAVSSFFRGLFIAKRNTAQEEYHRIKKVSKPAIEKHHLATRRKRGKTINNNHVFGENLSVAPRSN